MSAQVDVAFINQFNATSMSLSQQKGSRLQDKVRNESQKGEAEFFERIGTVAAVELPGRHSETPYVDTPHTRRMVTMKDYVWADRVDDQDKIRMLIDPTSEYAAQAAYAFGRTKDSIIISNALGNAYGGKTGSSSIALPAAQKYASNDGSALKNLTVATLRHVKKMMDVNEVEGRRFIACTASQIESLLGQTEVTSADFNTVRALAQGEINSFLGFEFVRTELLANPASGTSADPTTGITGSGTDVGTSSYRSCIAWAEMGLLMTTGMEYETKIDVLPGMNYTTQVYARMSIGSTRMEEVQVVEVICKEA